ncbi:hypothetical protein [Alicyclobacillus acidocaldarius]|nr:hypothetical protein [Alicyclobacillus acidocaldarius]
MDSVIRGAKMMLTKVALILLFSFGIMAFNRYMKKQTERIEEKIQSNRA